VPPLLLSWEYETGAVPFSEHNRKQTRQRRTQWCMQPKANAVAHPVPCAMCHCMWMWSACAREETARPAMSYAMRY
jgi:hypothetical protein